MRTAKVPGLLRTALLVLLSGLAGAEGASLPRIDRLGGALPIWFEPNRGQVGGRTEWTARAAGAWLFLTSNEAVYVLPGTERKTTSVHMRIIGGRAVKGRGEEAMASYSNYFVGRDEKEWFTGVPHFGRVRYAEVYPGIDLIYYATGRNVEYDFAVRPGGDPGVIELAFDGVGPLRVDEAGDLVVEAGGKSFRQRRPCVFQGDEEIAANYRITERGTVVLDVEGYDPALALRVDPVLDFATFLGGPGADSMDKVVIAPDGNPVLMGFTQSPASPVLDPFQQPSVVSMAPIVLKMSADGQRPLFFSILGRNGWDSATGGTVDSAGRIVVVGSTISTDFPLRNPVQSEFKGPGVTAFLTRISADGKSLVHSTYFGGAPVYGEGLHAAAVDDADNVFAVGSTLSRDIPLQSPIQAHSGGAMDIMITKFDTTGKLLFSTFWGGPGSDHAMDVRWRADGMLLISGSCQGDGFPFVEALYTQPTAKTGWHTGTLVLLDTKSNTIRLSTYLGDAFTGFGSALDIDREGNIYIAGGYFDRRFPYKNPLFSEMADSYYNGFVMSLRPDGRTVRWATALPAVDPTSISSDGRGAVHISGLAFTGVPLKNSFHPFRGGGIMNADPFVAKISSDGSLLIYLTLLGGTSNEGRGRVAAGADGSVYLAASTTSQDYPTKFPYQGSYGGGSDGVLARISDNTTTPPPAYRVSPPNVNVPYVQGEPAPGVVSLAVSNLTEAITVQSSVEWLRVAPARLSASGTVQVTPVVQGLAVGTHKGTVQVGTIGVEVQVTVLARAPEVQKLTPGLVPVGSDDTEIVLSGSGFTRQTTIYVNTLLWSLSPVRYVSATQISFTLPKDYFRGEASYSITVRNPDSAVSKPLGLAVGKPAPAIAAQGIVSAASFAGGGVAPGEIVTIFGENFEVGVQAVFDTDAVTPLFVSERQLSVSVPYSIAGAREVTVMIRRSIERQSTPVRVPVLATKPALFTANASGKGFAAALNQDGTVNSTGNPAARGSIVALFGTGGGPLTGKLLALPVKAFIDGMECEVLYAGAAPGLAEGAMQVNVRVPEYAVKGEVVVRVGERESPEGVIIAIP